MSGIISAQQMIVTIISGLVTRFCMTTNKPFPRIHFPLLWKDLGASSSYTDDICIMSKDARKKKNVMIKLLLTSWHFFGGADFTKITLGVWAGHGAWKQPQVRETLRNNSGVKNSP